MIMETLKGLTFIVFKGFGVLRVLESLLEIGEERSPGLFLDFDIILNLFLIFGKYSLALKTERDLKTSLCLYDLL